MQVHRIIELQHYFYFTSYCMKVDDSEIVVRKKLVDDPISSKKTTESL